MAEEHSTIGASWPAENVIPLRGNASAGNSSGQSEAEDAAEGLFCLRLANTRLGAVLAATPVGVASLMVSYLVVRAIMMYHSRNLGHYFLVSMAVSGILQAIVQLLIASVNMFDRLFSLYHSDKNFCLARIALSNTAYFSSVNNVCLIAVDHYLFIVHSIIHHRLVTKHKALASIAFTWIFSIGYGLLAFGVKKDRRNKCCAVTEVVPKYYEYYVLLDHYLICLALCVFVYGKISCVSLTTKRKDNKERRRISRGIQSEDRSGVSVASVHNSARRKTLVVLQLLVTKFQLETLGDLRSFRIFLAVMASVLGVWGMYFFGRLHREFDDSSNTFGKSEDSEWYLSLVNSSTVLLCSTYAYVNTEIRKAIAILVLHKLNKRLRNKLIDKDRWMNMRSTMRQQSDEADVFHNMLYSIDQTAFLFECDSPTSSAPAGHEAAEGREQPQTNVDSGSQYSFSTATLMSSVMPTCDVDNRSQQSGRSGPSELPLLKWLDTPSEKAQRRRLTGISDSGSLASTSSLDSVNTVRSGYDDGVDPHSSSQPAAHNPDPLPDPGRPSKERPDLAQQAQRRSSRVVAFRGQKSESIDTLWSTAGDQLASFAKLIKGGNFIFSPPAARSHSVDSGMIRVHGQRPVDTDLNGTSELHATGETESNI